MRQLRDPVWQVRGTSWVWDEGARNQICAACEVWSLRHFLRAKGNWPDDLPSNGGSAITALQYTIDGGATWTALSGTGTGARTLTMAASGTAYTFALRAVNAVGAGTASATKSATSELI